MQTDHARSRSGSRALAVALAAVTALACSKPQDAVRAQRSAIRTDAGALTVAGPDVYLRVEAFRIPALAFGNPAPIAMWGFVATDASFTPRPGTTAQAPGPTIVAVEGSTLRIHVRNDLAGQPYAEPVSLIVPGQPATMTPVWFDPATGEVTSSTTGLRPPGDTTSRVRSFTTETPPDGSTVTTYTFTTLRPGTYLYESGTHPAVQVQMGLYGALKVYPLAPRRAYADATSAFDQEVTLLYSEIDPVLHLAIECGNYGPNAAPVPSATHPDCAAVAPPRVTSTVDHLPRYFLVNGRPFTPGRPPLPGVQPQHRLLLRFLNAGLDTSVPTVLGPHLSIVAEDGHFISVTSPAGAIVPAARQQYSLLLAAGKTMDTILSPAHEGIVPVFDRRMNLTNAGSAPGGQLVQLAMGEGEGESRVGLGVSPSELGFEATRAGTTRTRRVTIRNPFDDARVVSAAQILGPQADAFSVAWSSPISLDGGASAALTVSFSPRASGADAATLAITTDDPDQPLLLVPLTGTGR